jgi:CBS domain containing-hemolysin-like protein
MWRLLLYLWPLPVTLLGLLVALLARSSGGDWRGVDGVLEAAGGWPARLLRHGFPFSGAVAAITLGHVVVGVSAAALAATRAHERAHVRQFERWGVLMVVLYPLAGLLAWMRGGHPYRDNRFEREARAAEAGARN